VGQGRRGGAPQAAVPQSAGDGSEGGEGQRAMRRRGSGGGAIPVGDDDGWGGIDPLAAVILGPLGGIAGAEPPTPGHDRREVSSSSRRLMPSE
jgi:hypothetical protein